MYDVLFRAPLIAVWEEWRRPLGLAVGAFGLAAGLGGWLLGRSMRKAK